MTWLTAKIDDIVTIAGGGTPSKQVERYFQGTIPWVSPKDMKSWNIVDSQDHITEEAIANSTTTLLPSNSVLVVIRSGVLKHTLPVGINRVPVTINQDMKALQCRPEVHPDYLARALKWVSPTLLKSVRGTTADNISTDVLRGLEIPLPPLSEQQRIAGILDQADGLRRKRQQALSLTDQFLRSTFLDLFGDPVTNPKGLRQAPLSDCVTFVSGGTPSKSRKDYWKGMFPWVSPKDMKRVSIDDAEDHISETVFDETNLKRLPVGAVLLVVRGMILAHTVPIAIAARPLAINQDMRAMLTQPSVVPEFLLWNLKVIDRYILSRVATAAHGTKRLEMDEVSQFPVLLPSLKNQARFASIVSQFGNTKKRLNRVREVADNLFDALVQRAFRGEL